MKIFVRTGKKIFFSIFLTALCLSAVNAQEFIGTGFTVTDNGGRVATSCSTVTVSGVVGSRNVRSISLTGTHSWLGDIEVRVYPPSAAPPPSTTGTTVIASPPDGRACNLSGTYRFIDSAAQSLDAATVGCADATNVAPGDYRTSTYGGGTNPGPVTSLATSFGALTDAQANGNWLICVFDFAAPDGGAFTSTALQLTVLSAASVSVGGRVTGVGGNGLSKVNVTLTNSSGLSRTVLTSPFGYYRFDDVSVGEVYTVTVAKKGIEFANPTQAIMVNENMDTVDFSGVQQFTNK
jgi:subtilisin-like proprotein convertase family protein